MPSLPTITVAQRTELHNAIWGLGEIRDNSNQSRRRILRRRIYQVLDSDRHFDKFLAKAYEKFREGKAPFEADDGFFAFVLQWIKDHPKEILELFVRILSLVL